MTLQIEPKTATRPDLLMIAGVAAATGGAALALGSDAVVQTVGGRKPDAAGTSLSELARYVTV